MRSLSRGHERHLNTALWLVESITAKVATAAKAFAKWLNVSSRCRDFPAAQLAAVKVRQTAAKPPRLRPTVLVNSSSDSSPPYAKVHATPIMVYDAAPSKHCQAQGDGHTPNVLAHALS